MLAYSYRCYSTSNSNEHKFNPCELVGVIVFLFRNPEPTIFTQLNTHPKNTPEEVYPAESGIRHPTSGRWAMSMAQPPSAPATLLNRHGFAARSTAAEYQKQT